MRTARRASTAAASRFLKIFFVAALLIAPAIPEAAASGGATRRAEDSHPLTFDGPVQRSISGGETHRYTLALMQGQALHVLVDQRGFDLAVALSGPDGRKLFEADSPAGDRGPELISLIAEEAGTYRLDVSAKGKATAKGVYELRAEEPRPAGERDRVRASAARLLLEGHQKIRSEDAGRAGETYAEARELFRRAEDRVGEAVALRHLGNLLLWQAAAERGVASLNESLAVWRELGDLRSECAVLKELGDAYANLGEEKKAFGHLDRAIELTRAIGDRAWEADLLADTAALVFDQRQQGLDNLLLALSIYRDLGDTESVAWTLNNIGAFYTNLGEHQAATGYFDQALSMWRELGDRRMEAFLLRNIGKIYMHAGRYAQALDHMNRALTFFRDTIPHQHATTLEVIGDIHGLMGERQKALDYYNKSVEIRNGLGRIPGNLIAFPRLLLSLARLHADLGERDRALEYLNQALKNIPDIPHRNHHAFRWRETGLVYNSLADHEKAIGLFRQALEIDQAIAYRSGEAGTLAALATAERDAGRLAEARAHAEEAIGIAEAFRSRFEDDQLRAAYTATVQGYYDLLIDILMRLHAGSPREGFDATALEASERKRARSLLELLAEARVDVRGGVDPALLERERTLRRRLNASADRQTELLQGKHSPEQAAAVSSEISFLTSEFQRVQTEIRQKSPRYAGLTQPSPLGMREIQRELLDPDTVLLEYALGGERSYLFAVTSDSVSSYELPKRSEVEAGARKAYELLTARNLRPPGETLTQRQSRLARADREYGEAASRLSRMVLGPVRSALGRRRLLIVADGALQYVPFAALPEPPGEDEEAGAGTSQPLVAGHEVVNLPSASVLAVLRRETQGRRSAPRSVAVIADPVFAADDPRVRTAGKNPPAPEAVRPPVPGGPERPLRDFGLTDERGALARLPFSREEAEAIMRVAPAGSGLKALDFRASRAVATGAELSQYRVVHFATHGLLNTEQPALSGLVFSLVDERRRRQDGFLRLHEIYNLNLPAELVVLSACQTGLGKEVRGEGLLGLTRGFMYAGARRVAASLWKVDDGATAEIMGRFYREMLAKGKTPASALRAAQVEMLGEKQWQAPYYWAAFTLQGEYR